LWTGAKFQVIIAAEIEGDALHFCCIGRSINKATLTLVANGENIDAINGGQKTIQRHIASTTFRDHKFTQIVRHRTPD